MKDDNEAFRQEVAAFRFAVIQDLVHLAPGQPGNGALMAKLAGRSWKIPGSRRQRIAAETIRTWLRRHRAGGFEALKPRNRGDRGNPRRMTAETVETLIAIKTENRDLTVRGAIKHARDHNLIAADVPLPPSTVHRLFDREDLIEPPSETAKDRRRFTYEWANDLWMSDVMHGPKAGDGRRRRKTYLIAFIDDATRIVPDAAFAFSENTAACLAVMRRATARRGIPKRLYVDNGSCFRSKHLSLVCAKLGIALLHARPYQPAGKGKIERWFRTVRGQFLPTLQNGDTTDLETLNRRLAAWIEGEYHQRGHCGLNGIAPFDKWAAAADDIKLVGPDLDDLFLDEEERRVLKDRTVTLNRTLYEVDAALIGCKVILRFDPSAPPSRPLQVMHDGKDAGKATRLDALANARTRRMQDPDREPEEPEASPLSLRDLAGNGGTEPCT